MSKSHLPNLMHLRETHFCSNLAFINESVLQKVRICVAQDRRLFKRFNVCKVDTLSTIMSKSHLPNLMHLRETHFCSNLAFIIYILIGVKKIHRFCLVFKS